MCFPVGYASPGEMAFGPEMDVGPLRVRMERRKQDHMFRIYVGNLNYQTTEDSLRDLFSQHGTVQSVAVITDRETGRPRGFGFVEMADEGQGREAIEALHGQQFEGRTLTVNEARPREQRSNW